MLLIRVPLVRGLLEETKGGEVREDSETLPLVLFHHSEMYETFENRKTNAYELQSTLMFLGGRCYTNIPQVFDGSKKLLGGTKTYRDQCCTGLEMG